MKEKLETPFVSISMEQGIVIVDFTSPEIKLEEAKQTVDMRLEFIEGKSYPVLVDGRKVTSIDKQSRDYFSSEKATQGVKAGGILMSSTFNKFLGNFFLRVTYSKSKLPTRLFTDKKEAMKWLSKYK